MAYFPCPALYSRDRWVFRLFLQGTSMEAKNKKKDTAGELIILAIIAGIAVFMLFASRDFKLLGRLFPQIVSTFTLVMCVIQAAILLKKSSAPKKSGKPENNLKNHFVIAGIGLAYFVLLPFVGFILTTMMLMVVIPTYLGCKNKLIIWTMALLSTGILYYVFKTLFYVSLPQGLITFI